MSPAERWSGHIPDIQLKAHKKTDKFDYLLSTSSYSSVLQSVYINPSEISANVLQYDSSDFTGMSASDLESDHPDFIGMSTYEKDR